MRRMIKLPEHFHAIGDTSASGQKQTSCRCTLYHQTCLRHSRACTPAPLHIFGHSNSPLRCAVCSPHIAGFGPQAGVRCKQCTGCGLKHRIWLRKRNLFMKYSNRNKVAAVCLSPECKTITSEVVTYCFSCSKNTKLL